MHPTTAFAILATSTLLTGTLAQNMFKYPTASAGQSFKQGDNITVSWQTDYKEPYLDLFCSYINNQLAYQGSADMDYNITILLALALLGYTIYGAINRLFLSPVAKVPGPRLAILSFWYEFYYDVVLQGRYGYKIAELHKQYGPIIRINPYEVHIDDPDFYDEVYVLGGKRKSDIWTWSAPMFGTPNSILATIEHDVHRRRRNAYSTFFSKQSIRKYSGVVQANMDRVIARFKEYQSKGQPVNLMHAWTAFTGDVVSEYCFPESYGFLKRADFAPEYYELWISIVSNSHILKQFPWLFPMMNTFPMWFVDRFLPDLAVSYRWHRQWAKQIQDIKSGERDTVKERGRPSVFETLLDSDLPPYDKSVSRLVEDAQTLVGAGSITTSLILALTTYYVITDEEILDKCMDELTQAIPDTDHALPLVELEKLPYLSAIILEALRICYGVSHRLQRVCPNEVISYNDYVLPPGTPVSMTSMLVHDNVSIFPDPRIFKPERWLPLETEGARLQKYLVAFSRGSRQCLGMHLGSAELYIGLSGLLRHFGRQLTVVDTVKERDVDLIRDTFTPAMSPETKGIKVKIDKA
ncbi:uncharacterized protein KY384_002929 [Bacidia gigantensis]|uniref:uncharacterized protein n=1 Tax=Bacidia gigantensis TaxID=2732470 RepID=UPI001D04CA68|nr:uncharacterized protein KY384_002929 [Bacidia gigantensis]KAG8531301.1 hypothetical protein KY384_002929 [Bacidia gigantensis]